MKKLLAYLVLAFLTCSICFPAPSQASSSVVTWGFSSEGLSNVPTSATNVVALAAGGLTSYVLKRDGTVVAWGDGYSGQTNVPATATNIVAIGANGLASGGYPMALRADGAILTWSDFSSSISNIPVDLTNAVAIAAGGRFALALKPDGTVVAWGANDYGQTNIPSGLTNVIAIAAGDFFGLALKNDGTVFAWGGYTDSNNRPTNVPPGLGKVVAIAAGDGHALALQSSGTVVAWGSTNSGESTVPAGLSNAVAIAGGGDFSLALKSDGRVVAWGNNVWNRTNVPPTTTNIVAITAGTYQSLALVGDGVPHFSRFPISQTQPAGGEALFCMPAVGAFPLAYQWQFNGTNIDGATNWFLQKYNVQEKDAGGYRLVASNSCGAVTSEVALLTVAPSAPVFRTEPADLTIWPSATMSFNPAIYASEPLSCQWRFNGEALPGETNIWLSWSNVQLTMAGSYDLVLSNSYGAVTSRLAKLSVNPVVYWGYPNATPPDLSDVIALAGMYHGLALHPNGTVTSWGDNSAGQTNVPPDLTNAIAIAGGAGFSMALRADGTVTAWGDNASGQTNIPAGLSNIIAIAAGGGHGLALRSDGTVVAWGLNNHQQASVPADLSDVVAISAGNTHSLALRANGTVVAWGDPGQWQIYVPANLSNVVAIAAGYSFSLALCADGSVVSWGNPNGSTGSVPGESNFVAVSAGDSHCLALRQDGTVVAWGNGYSGQTKVPNNLSHVVDVVGGMWHSMALVGVGAPRLNTRIAPQRTCLGGSAFLQASVSGARPMSYQWQLNGTNLVGATNWFLRLFDVSAENTGDYTITISNEFGVTTSPAATLSMIMPEFDASPGYLQMSSSGLQMRLQGFSGQGNIVIYASTNLNQWEPIWTNTLTIGPVDFTDSGATNQNRRFYRAGELR